MSAVKFDNKFNFHVNVRTEKDFVEFHLNHDHNYAASEQPVNNESEQEVKVEVDKDEVPDVEETAENNETVGKHIAWVSDISMHVDNGSFEQRNKNDTNDTMLDKVNDCVKIKEERTDIVSNPTTLYSRSSLLENAGICMRIKEETMTDEANDISLDTNFNHVNNDLLENVKDEDTNGDHLETSSDVQKGRELLTVKEEKCEDDACAEMNISNCENCLQNFDTIDQLHSHQQQCEIEFPCLDCGDNFSDRISFLDHSEFCGQALNLNFRKIVNQMSEELTDECYYVDQECQTDNIKTLSCSKCHSMFISEELYDMHREVCLNTEKCKRCEKCFTDKNQLKDHLPVCEKRPVFSCSICGKSFGKKHVLVLHMKIHTGDRKFICKICSKAFIHKHQLKNHMNMHGTERLFKCDQCENAYKYISNLNKHKATHLSVQERRKYFCQFCNQGFFHNYHRKRHEEIHLDRYIFSRSFQCEKCPAKFRYNYQLNKHLKCVHEKGSHGKRQLECNECGHTFFWKSHLQKHLKIFHGVKNMESDNCDDDSSVEDELAEILETEDRVNGNPDRGKRNVLNDAMILKNLKKKGEFECKDCERVFRSAGNLDRHMKLMHDQE